MYHSHQEDHRNRDYQDSDYRRNNQRNARFDTPNNEQLANDNYTKRRTEAPYDDMRYTEPYVDIENLRIERYYDVHAHSGRAYDENSYYDEGVYENGPYEYGPYEEGAYDEHPKLGRDEHVDGPKHRNSRYTPKHIDPAIYEYDQEQQQGALFADDFYDAQHSKQSRLAKSLGKIGGGVAIALFTIGFAAITIFASKPQMTPHEIVQMDGYKGSERDLTLFFNLASLRGCSSIDDCDGVIKAGRKGDSAASDLPTTTSHSLSEAGQPIDQDSHLASEAPLNYQEIPAASTLAAQLLGSNQTFSSDNENNVNQLWRVSKQWSIVRETPARNGAIITSLAADKRVTIISRVGEWCEISTVASPSKPTVMGYMHSSLLQPM